MFGKLKQIAEGWTDKVFKYNEDLYQKRLKICQKCPLYTVDAIFHGKCDASKCYDPITEKVEHIPTPDNICGCGCSIDAAARVPNKKCVLNKW